MKTIIKKTILGALLSASIFAQQKLVLPGSEIQVYYTYFLSNPTPLPENKLEAVKKLGTPHAIYYDEWGNGTETVVYRWGISLSYDAKDLDYPESIRLRNRSVIVSDITKPQFNYSFYITNFKLAVGGKVHQDLLDKYWYRVYDEQNKGACKKGYYFSIYNQVVNSLSDYYLSVCVDSAEKITEIYYGGPA
jgi:hypothetical protein